mgnify:CR=1 FL=1
MDTFINDIKELSVTLSNFSAATKIMSQALERSVRNGFVNQNVKQFAKNTMDAGLYIIPIINTMARVQIPTQWAPDDELVFAKRTTNQGENGNGSGNEYNKDAVFTRVQICVNNNLFKRRTLYHSKA